MTPARKRTIVKHLCRELRAGAAFLSATLHPGETEREAANRLRSFFRRRGYRRWAFRFIIAAGPSAAEPHHVPTTRRLRRGDMIVCDFGLREHSVSTDMSRTFILGRAEPKLRRVYSAVLTAQTKAAGQLRPGVTGAAIDAIARRELTRRGFGRAFIHGTGHGVGYKIHEPPWLSPRGQTPLRPGDIVTVEPGVYLKGWGGVRIEDMYCLTARGAEQLTRVPSSLRDAIIPL